MLSRVTETLKATLLWPFCMGTAGDRWSGHCLQGFVAAYMKLAVETFAQNQKSHSVHMEIVAAARTFTERGQKGYQYQDSNPEAKQSSHCFVGGRNGVGNHHCGNIHKQRAEKILAASSSFFQDIHVPQRTDRTVIHSFPPAVRVKRDSTQPIPVF